MNQISDRCVNPRFDVEIGTDFIRIYYVEPTGGAKVEVLYWEQTEWEDDPTVTISIANAICEAYTAPDKLFTFCIEKGLC